MTISGCTSERFAQPSVTNVGCERRTIRNRADHLCLGHGWAETASGHPKERQIGGTSIVSALYQAKTHSSGTFRAWYPCQTDMASCGRAIKTRFCSCLQSSTLDLVLCLCEQ
ncbi:hypothetical protein BDZ89DRAFT_1074099 [Hymenopellis radicata]|nr:hypothetical protein BDZ89DRAFT_1074099 [Hymenopellis radicata]